MTPRGARRAAVASNLASLVVLAVAGLVLNLVVGAVFGPGPLGVFNQVFALYILLSQLSVLGVQQSILYHLSVARDAQRGIGPEVRVALWSAVLTVTAASAATVLGCVLLLPAIRAALGSDVASGLVLVLPGLWLFAVNKVLLNALNGLERLHAFAFGQGLRYVTMVAAVLTFAALDRDPLDLAVILTLAELVLLPVLLVLLRGLPQPDARPDPLGEWVRRHVRFGMRSLASGAMTELNSRVDVLVLGLFTPDEVVGVYSIAALLMEGMSQIPLVLRNVLNPQLAQLYREGRLDEMWQGMRRTTRITYAAMVPASMLGLTLYRPFVDLVLDDPQFGEAFVPFAILAVGVVAVSGYLPYDMLLSQTGQPGAQAVFKVMVVVTNAVLSLALTPYLGMVGAAVATAVAMSASVPYLWWMAQRHAGLRIPPLRLLPAARASDTASHP